jgi:hypothetical protein
MNYLVALLPDRIQAEAVYVALEKAGLPTNQIAILGRGYQSADEYGLTNPNQQAKQGASRLAYSLIPFGFVAGYAFNLITEIEIWSWAGTQGNHLIGGVFGAIAGAMGAFFVGGGVGLTLGSGDALTYRNRLNAGKYLVVVNGTEAMIQQANLLMRQFEPENLRIYDESGLQ